MQAHAKAMDSNDSAIWNHGSLEDDHDAILDDVAFVSVIRFLNFLFVDNLDVSAN